MASEEAAAGLKEIRDDVLRKIGRNLLIFQDIERMLKFFVTSSRLQITMGAGGNAISQRAPRVADKTLGQIKQDFIDRVFSRPREVEALTEANRQARISISFSIEADADFVDRYERTFDDLIAERNQLVHHFLSKCDLTSVDSLAAAARDLDEQRERSLVVYDGLKSTLETIRECSKVQVEVLESEEGRRALNVMQLQASSLVRRLAEVALQIRRPDGWALLSVAASLLRAEVAEHLPKLTAECGTHNLKSVLLTAEVFDVAEEPTPDGGVRTIYRVRRGARSG